MDLHATILGLLSWKPFSGYDLKRIISDSGVFYWSGNNNQIYKSLLEIEREGLVTHQVQVQESLPAKKLYTITAQGLSELRKSLLASPELPELHNNFLIQLAWSDPLSDQEILTLLGKYEEEITARLLMHKVLALKSDGIPGRSKREIFIWGRITANLGAAYQSELDWVRQTRSELNDRNYLV